MMRSSNMRRGRLITGLLFLGVLCAGAADLSHAATIGFIGADETTTPVESHLDSAGGASALVISADLTPHVQTGGLSAISRAILHIRYCVCSGIRQFLTSSSPVSTESTAPVTPLPAVPAAMFLFVTGLVTVVGVARSTDRRLIPLLRTSIPIAAPRMPVPGYLLLVSDDTRFTQDLATRFAHYRYIVESVPGTIEAGVLASRQTPALVIIDRRRPGWHGLRRMAQFQSVPMMTVMPASPEWTEDACVGDLELGMDSTHVCGENHRLLVAKVRALLRRSAWMEQTSAVVRAGQVELDADRCEVRVAGQVHHLPPVQFKLLKRLMESPGRLFRRQELLDHIWGEGYAVEGHTLDVHICWLRRLLAHDQARRQTIATIRGIGIKFVVEPDSNIMPPACDAWVPDKRVRRVRPRPRISRSASRSRIRPSVAMHTAV